MSRLKSRIAALERRKAPGDLVYVLNFDPAGMSREVIVAEVARRRAAARKSPHFVLTESFAVLPEVAKSSEEWLEKFAPGGSERARWGK
jgi:hypothetical protein